MLEEGVSNHCHEGVTVKAVPRSPLEVIETEFFLQLLMRLFANPAGLDGGCQEVQVRPGGQVSEIVFFLSRDTLFANEPGLVPRQMLLTLVPNPLWRTVSRANADRGKSRLQLALCSDPPAQGSPLDVGQYVFGRYR